MKCLHKVPVTFPWLQKDTDKCTHNFAHLIMSVQDHWKNNWVLMQHKKKQFSGCSSRTVHIIITYTVHNIMSIQCDSDLPYDFINCGFPFLWLPLYSQVRLLWFFIDLFPFLLTFYVSAACLVQLSDHALHLCHFRTPQLLHLLAHLLVFCTLCTQGLKSQ